MQAKERIFKLVKKIVEQRKLGLEKSEDQEHQNTIPNDAVDVLLRDISGEQNDKQSLSLDFIISHIIELMIPGEETVPMSMTLAVKFLSDCPVALELLTVYIYIYIYIYMYIYMYSIFYPIINHHKIEFASF
jgi:3-epi-6-deoxocathasterone 23-monooxygenase